MAKLAAPSPYAERLHALCARLASARLDGYYVQDRLDQYWLTGFTGEDGAAIVTRNSVVLLTDGRFDQAADAEAPFARKVIRKQRNSEANAKVIRQLRVARLGFNPDAMHVREFAELKKLTAPARWVAIADPVRPLRIVKDADEIDRLRVAARVAEEAFEAVRRRLNIGMTEREIAAELDYEMARRGAQAPAFETIVAVGPNSSLPHFEPGSRRLTDTEPLLVDWGARVNWYGSDLTRVLWLGTVAKEYRTIFEVVREAHAAGIAAVKPGAKASAVDAAARRVIDKAGYGKQFNHATGHGIGLRGHEPPRIGRKVDERLTAGMVITIEPGIYLPGVGGVRLEDDVLVTETGHEVITHLPLQWS